jgi:uncharacterized membrane protein YeaQ/YmgE (transglycosylase-associated protein family)
MTPIAELVLSPGGVISWIAMGLIAGWLAGLTMSGRGYGIVRDTLLGLVGAGIGGLAASYFIAGDAGFWGSMLVAFLGACIVIAIARLLVPNRATRV